MLLKSEWKKCLYQVLDEDIHNVSFDEKMLLLEKYIIEYQKENEDKRELFNYKKPWSDDDLRIILQSSPTAANCLRYAKLFGRGYGSIEQIYRWASTSDKEVKRKRSEDVFIAQIKRIAKEVGWRAG